MFALTWFHSKGQFFFKNIIIYYFSAVSIQLWVRSDVSDKKDLEKPGYGSHSIIGKPWSWVSLVFLTWVWRNAAVNMDIDTELKIQWNSNTRSDKNTILSDPCNIWYVMRLKERIQYYYSISHLFFWVLRCLKNPLRWINFIA